MKSGSILETSTTLRKAAPALDLGLQKAPSGPLLAALPFLPLMVNATQPPEAQDHSFTSCSGPARHEALWSPSSMLM